MSMSKNKKPEIDLAEGISPDSTHVSATIFLNDEMMERIGYYHGIRPVLLITRMMSEFSTLWEENKQLKEKLEKAMQIPKENRADNFEPDLPGNVHDM